MTTTVTSFTASPASGTVHAGDTITFVLTLSGAVTVYGGTPTLTLNDGGVAVYDAPATAALGNPAKMVFSYKVAVSDRPVDGVSFVRGNYNGATVADTGGQIPDLSGVYTSTFAGLQIVTSGPDNATLFAGTDAYNHVNLWVTDGTPNGTSELYVNGASANGLQPTSFVTLGGTVIFVGMDSANRQSLWISDGTSGGTSELSIPGMSSLASTKLVRAGDKVIFSGIDALGTSNAWVTDGTANGTLELPATSPTNITQVGNKVYFSGVDQLGRRNVWVTDETANGTSELMISGVSSLDGSGFTALGNKVLFTANNSLWVTDGTGAGTSQLAVAGASTTYKLSPSSLVVLGNKVLFAGIDAADHASLWVSDGTAAGTSELSVPGVFWSRTQMPGSLTIVGDKVLFVAQDASFSSRLWITDGTGAGTSMLQIAGMGIPDSLTAFGDKVIFRAGSALWVSDGTVAGTSQLGTNVLLLVNNPNFTVSGGEVFFEGRNSADQLTLWKTDGTAAGTVEIPVASGPHVFTTGRGFTSAGSTTFFVGRGPVGDRLWITDGSSGGTTQLNVDARFSRTDFVTTYLDPHFGAFGNKVLFVGWGSTGSIDLWVSDGTTGGTTKLVSSLFYSFGTTDPQFTVFGNKAIFAGRDSTAATGLWVTDGTVVGTSALSVAGASTIRDFDGGLAPRTFQVFGDKVLFQGRDTSDAYGLWVTDGTSAGTIELVGAASAFGHTAVSGFTTLGNKALFVATNASGNEVLAVTDGTAGGTSEIPVAGASRTVFNPSALTMFGDKVLFVGTDASGNLGMWSTDGTSAGTTELFVGFGTAPKLYANLGGKLIFGGPQPYFWVTDGTAAGTTEFQIPGISGMNNTPLGVQGGRVLFWVFDANGRNTIWSSDGTLAGTSELSVAGAYAGGIFYQMPTVSSGGVFQNSIASVSVGGKTVFTGRDASGKISLFATDGTAAGSYEIVINGAAPTGIPTNLAVVNGKIVFNDLDASGNSGLWVTDGTSGGTYEMSLSQAGSTAPGPFGPIGSAAPPASVVSFIGSPASGVLHAGDTVTLTMTMNRGVSVSGGTLTLTLNDGGMAVYNAAATAALGDPAKMVFSYTVGASDLPQTGLSVVRGDQAGAVIVDSSGNSPDFSGAFGTSVSGVQVATVPTAVTSVVASPSNGVEKPGDIVTFTITMNRAVTITGGTPTLTLNDGGIASYDAAATAALGDSTKMVFSYTVGASDLPVASLSFVRGDQNGAVITDASGHGPDFTGIFTAAFPGVQLAPTAVTSVVASPSSGQEHAGDVVAFTLTMSRAVTVTGGTPTFTLNDGGVAVYDAAATAALGDPTKLVFTYKVGANDLPVNGLSFVRGDQNGAVIADAAGRGPDLSPVFNTAFSGIQVETTAPGVHAVGSEFQLSSERFVTVTELAGGNLVATWLDANSLPSSPARLHIQIYDASGAKIGAELIAPAPNGVGLATTALANGGFAVAWYFEDSRTNAYNFETQVFDSTGAPVGDPLQANTDSVSYTTPSITALANGGYIVTWQSGSFFTTLSIKGQIFDANGAKIGGELLVGDNYQGAALAGLGDGNFVAVTRLKGEFELSAQLFDPQGNKIGASFIVNSDPRPWIVQSPKVATLPTGGFVVVWQEFNNTQPVVGMIEGQQFDADGHKIGAQFRVNTNTVPPGTPISYLLDVTALADGNFVVTWQDISGTLGDSSGSSIKAQVFDAYHQTRIGGEFLVNTQTAGNQSVPTVAALQNGGFMISWPTDTGTGYRAQIFAADSSVVTIATGGTLEVPTASSVKLAFAPGGAALQLDQSAAFSGSITGFGEGDSIDLADIAFSNSGMALGYTANASNTGGHLTVSDGRHTAALTLLGQYSAGSFVLSADGHGGTLINSADPTGQAQLAAHA